MKCLTGTTWITWPTVALAVACGGTPRPEPVIVPEPPALTMSAAAFGPLSEATPATLVALRAALAGYEVRPVHQDGLEYQVFEDGARIFTVVPRDGAIFNIHVASPKIVIAGHADWKVGAKFRDWQRLSTCVCWGGQPVCFRDGEHVAVSFDRGCGGLQRSLRGLEGLAIARTIWSPRPFGEEPVRIAPHDGELDEDHDDPCGP